MQVDGYKGYKQVFASGLAFEVGCWMHGRRPFVRAFEGKDMRAAKPLELIRQMYAVEAASREENESHEARLVRRQRDTTPILDELRTWLDEHMGSEPPSSPLGKAIAYVDNKWAVLRCFLYDGALEIDNGDVERALRGTATRGSLCITPSSTWKQKGSLVRRIATRATTTMGACA
jgi:transposase